MCFMAYLALGYLNIVAVLKILRPFNNAPTVKLTKESVLFIVITERLKHRNYLRVALGKILAVTHYAVMPQNKIYQHERILGDLLHVRAVDTGNESLGNKA